MKRSILICPDEKLAEQLFTAVSATGEAHIIKIIGRYPNALELVRSVRTHAPDIIFLDFESVEQAQEIARLVDSATPGVQIIGVAREVDARLLRESMRLGIREFLTQPFDHEVVLEALLSVKNVLERTPPKHESTTQIFTFLPSKAGVGTSTLALNIAAAMAGNLKQRTLLSDFDLSSGMMRFFLKLKNNHSIIDAIQRHDDLDEESWAQLATSFGNLDVIHAGQIQPNFRVDPGQIHSLVDYFRRNYQVVCFDISGNLEKYSMELMRESRRVFLVCTQEIASLHLAREKLAFLREADMEARVSVLLNRCYKRPLVSKQQVEDLVGVPVMTMFPNDYNGVNQAMSAGTWITSDTELRKTFEHFAGEVLEKHPTSIARGKRKFLEFFSVPTQALVVRQK